MRRLLCWLGFHDWWATSVYTIHNKGRPATRRVWRECRYCPATEER